MDAFFASVEQHDRPELRGKPVLVGAPPDARGVVSAASYEARAFGIRSAMPSQTAYQRCPSAVFLPVNMVRYKEVSVQIMQIFETYTPWVQPLSIDEAFLDVTGSRRLFGSGREIAEKIRSDIHEITGLTASVGIAPNMFLAKLASDMNKPDGITEVPIDPQAIKQFLAPLPIGRIWGIGRVTREKFERAGIRTVGQLQQCESSQLEKWVGVRSAQVYQRLALGIDDRRVTLEREDKSISNEQTFKQDVEDVVVLRQTYLALIEKVGGRLRKSGHTARTVHLKVRWGNFSTITRQLRLSSPSDDDFSLREAGMQLFHAHLGTGRPVRLIGFGVSGFSCDATAADQLTLFDVPDERLNEKRSRLSHIADSIRDRYGNQSLQRGSALPPEK